MDFTLRKRRHRAGWALALSVTLGLVLPAAPAPAAYQFVAKWGKFDGAGNAVASNDDGAFREAGDAAVGPDSSVYVVDHEIGRVQKFTPGGAFLGRWGSLGNLPGQMSIPLHLAVGPDGSVYVADQGNSRVQQFNSAGGFVRQWGTMGPGPAQFVNPNGIATDPAGNVYVGDNGGDRVQVFSPTGMLLRQWGGPGAADGQLSDPMGMDVDTDGLVYVADTLNNRIQVFTPTGGFVRKWAIPSNPWDVEVGADGSVWVAEWNAHTVRRFDRTGNLLQTLGGLGTADGQFTNPGGVGTDCRGRLYVAEYFGKRVQVFAEPGTPLPPCLPPASPGAAVPGAAAQAIPAGSPDAGILNCATTIRVARNGTARLCDATNPPTASTVQSLTGSLPRAKAMAARRKRRKASPRTLTLGTGQTAIPAGETRAVEVKLTGPARRALKKKGKLRAAATIEARGNDGQTATVKRTVTFKPAQKPKKRKKR